MLLLTGFALLLLTGLRPPRLFGERRSPVCRSGMAGHSPSMETYDVPDSGYPEEQPAGTAEDDTGTSGGDSPPERSSDPSGDADRAPSNEDGKNTGGGGSGGQTP